MPINKETILSVYNDKLTLMQWLKTINKALEEAVLTSVEVRQKGNATFSFVVTFEDGTELESNEFVLAQGESINGAIIRNGHLYLSLTNGNELDAGNLKPVTNFTINEEQHLIVNYGDGTSQDLGAIFSGNVNIDGNFTANSIIENMNGYSLSKLARSDKVTYEDVYAGIVKNGNKLTLVLALNITKNEAISEFRVGAFVVPSEIANKLYPTTIGGFSLLNNITGVATASTSFNTKVDFGAYIQKIGNSIAITIGATANFVIGTKYYIRFELTFLLSDNLAQ